jgi:hypothetical protein
MSKDDKKKSPVRDYRVEVNDSGGTWTNRILIGHPVTGLLRVEWVQARYGQITPMNWSQVEMMQTMSGYYPLRYQVADAQNLIVKVAIEGDYEWVLLWEHDVCPPPNATILINQHMREEKYPVVSGLYYSRSRPSEPLVFRGRGTGVYTDWQQGDLVWCDGVPTGFLLIHYSILKAVWERSPEYFVKKHNAPAQVTRRVFNTPRDVFHDPATNNYSTYEGTSDLEWCTRLMKEDIFKIAGWDKYQEMKYPFLVDTNLFCTHINPNGERFP